MKIRRATPADIPAMMDLERVSATAGHWTQAQYRNLFAPDRSSLTGLVVVAADSESASALGFLVARRVGVEWELENIVVDAAARRHGIGAQLLDALLAQAGQTNNSAVFLEVRESNVAARALYEKSGFMQVGRRKGYYNDPPEDAVLYRWTQREGFS